MGIPKNRLLHKDASTYGFDEAWEEASRESFHADTQDGYGSSSQTVSIWATFR